ncbi:MAG: GDP-mannose 4,6-dehydratase [Bacteroidales bacterium]
MSKILILGANSTSGKALVNYLKQFDDELFFCDFTDSYSDTLSKNWFKTDISSFENIYKVLKIVFPDQIYNFAGSFTNNYDIDYKANVFITKNIFDSLQNLNHNARVLLIGSSAEYGIIDEKDNPVNENQPLNPASVYGLTKVYQTNLMKYYYNTYNSNVVMARTFNLLGMNMNEKLFIGKLYKLIDEFKKGIIDKITLGNIDNKRDYLKIDQAVVLYHKIINYGKTGEIYNVGSGNSIRICDLLESILIENGLDMNIVKIEKYSNKYDIKDIYSDNSKLNYIIDNT